MFGMWCIVQVEALLQPRFPLFGGWKVNFVFGYSLPLSGYATRLGNGQVQLVQMFSTPIKDLLVDDLTVKVILWDCWHSLSGTKGYMVG